MVQGFIYALSAGILISIQNVFVARTGEKIGFWEANTWIHGAGFVLAFIILMFFRKSGGSSILEVKKIYWVGLIIGVAIVFSVMQGVTRMGVVYAIPIMLTAQIIATTIIGRFGLFEEQATIPSPLNMIGVIMLVGGVVLSQVR